jgi:iron(III) transport system substrate-binding protein
VSGAGRRMTRRSALGLIAGGALFAAGCGRSGGGRLVVYSAGPRPLAEKIRAGYTTATGREVELFVATTGQIMAKLEAERFNPRADVVILASRVAAEALKARGRLRVTPLAGELARPEWHDAEGFYVATGAAMIGVALRADAQAGPEGGWDWEDFFGGAFPGRVTLPSPTRSGATSDFLMAYLQARGEERVWTRLKAARRAGLDIAGANAQAMSNLLTGASAAVVGAVDYVALREVARGEPVRVIYPASGGVLTTRPAAVLANSRRVEEAEAFLRYALGEEAQGEGGKLHFEPVRADAPRSRVWTEARAAWNGREMPLDAKAALATQTTALRTFQYEVERAVEVDG